MPNNPTQKNDLFDELFEPAFLQIQKTPSYAEYKRYLDDKERIITINDIVDDWLADEAILPIIKWNEEDKGLKVSERKPIKIYINSNGGHVDVAHGLISAIQASKTPVYTHVLGKAYSAGFLILVAGHKRFAFDGSTGLLHEGEMGVMGSNSKTRDFIKFSEQRNQAIKDMIVNRTKITPEMYDAKYTTEWYMLGNEMLDLGVVDKLIKF